MKLDFNKMLALIDILPGQKRTITCLFALGMLICQASATYFGPEYGHVFTATQWGAVGVTGGIFYQLKLLREEKEKV
jgi:hypothetical protein